MGLFVHIVGQFKCVRCGKVTEYPIQTKLLRSQRDNQSHHYGLNQTELIDGLDDFPPLWSWNPQSPMVVAIGDWGCDHCGLHWQWAKVTFEIVQGQTGMMGTIRSVTTLAPLHTNDLAGIHFIDSELVFLAQEYADSIRQDGVASEPWLTISVQHRGELIVSGFLEWLANVERNSN